MSNPAAQTFNRIPLPQLPLLPFDFLAENDHSVQTHSTSVQPSLSFVTTSLQSSRSTLDIAGSSKYQTLVYGDGKLTSSNTSFLSTEQNNLHDALTATDPSTIQKAPNRARDWFTRWFVEWWLMEIMSWLFGAVCMVIIATVLSKYDGKPDPRWKIGLSMSAFISIFSGFAKSALLLPTAEALGQLKWDWFRRSDDRIKDFERLDSASRGAWGSLILLVRTRKV
jgi:hypothetical protein